MPQQQLVIGTAGHVDHGKTSLVHALTGIDCDRLPEEKSRGLTIDLGFAHLEVEGRRMGIVDVPGHDRFVHNMVSGSTGVDLALLVIACDDSVMPQTREHLAILEYLGIQRGVIALTKRDLVDDEHLELVRQDVTDFVKGTFLEDAPMIPVSSVTGYGLTDLTTRLGEVAEHHQRSFRNPYFRLPIDRVFTLEGRGTIVTGTVRSGDVSVGETVELLGVGSRAADIGRCEVRVRRLQSHGEELQSVSAGQRAAVNLVGVKQQDISRGDELTQPGCFEPTRRLLVKLSVLEGEKRPLKHRHLVRLHLGAGEVTARVLLGGREIAPGRSGYAVLLCRGAVVAEYGQRFVLRRLSPVATLGGGVVLSPVPGRTRTGRLLEVASGFDNDAPASRIDAYLELRGEDSLTEQTLSVCVGIEEPAAQKQVQELIGSGRIVPSPDPKGGYLHAKWKQELKDRLLRISQSELESRRPARMIPVAPILTAGERWTSRQVVEWLLEELFAEGTLFRRGERIGVAGESAKLTSRERSTLDSLVAKCVAGGVAPPTLKDLAADVGADAKSLAPLVQVGIDSGRLIRISPDLVADPDALDQVRTSAVDFLVQHGPASVAELKEHWKVSRKYAIPYLELFDRLGVTKRAGDSRTIGPNAQRPLEELVE